MPILGGLLSGVFLSLMNICNATLSQAIGNIQASVITNLVATTLILPFFIQGIRRKTTVFDSKIPWWSYTAGISYVYTIMMTNYSIPRLGVSITLVVSLMGQTVTSLVMESTGIFSNKVQKIDRYKLLGLACIGLGAAVMILW